MVGQPWSLSRCKNSVVYVTQPDTSQLYFKPWNQSPYTAAICVNQPGGWKVNIEIGNLNPNTGFVLRPDDCYKELKSLTAGYSFWGAEEQQYGWYFRYARFLSWKSRQFNLQTLELIPMMVLADDLGVVFYEWFYVGLLTLIW